MQSPVLLILLMCASLQKMSQVVDRLLGCHYLRGTPCNLCKGCQGGEWCVAVCRARMEKEDLNPDNMIQPEDVCELVLLPFKVSANAVPQEGVLDVMKNPSA